VGVENQNRKKKGRKLETLQPSPQRKTPRKNKGGSREPVRVVGVLGGWGAVAKAPQAKKLPQNPTLNQKMPTKPKHSKRGGGGPPLFKKRTSQPQRRKKGKGKKKDQITGQPKKNGLGTGGPPQEGFTMEPDQKGGGGDKRGGKQ